MPGNDPERTVDVREVDGPPFGEITEALDALPEGERLRLVSDFEPEPLYAVLDARGFDHETTREGGTWRVTIEHA